jgi:hypothetical protein
MIVFFFLDKSGERERERERELPFTNLFWIPLLETWSDVGRGNERGRGS